MKKLFTFAFALALLMPAAAIAQSPWDGTWKIDLATAQMPTKPDVYMLIGGVYQCKTCVPQISVRADNTDQMVSGHPYYNMVNIKIVDDHTILETDKMNGKIVSSTQITVSPDGNTATFEFSDSSATNGAPVTGKGEATRVEKGPAGSHLISGSWRTTKMDSVSDNGLMFTYKVNNGALSMTTPTGQSFTVKLDGTEAPYKGDPGTTSVSVKTISNNTIEETDKLNGKVISVSQSIISADGKTMTISVSDQLHGTTSKFTATKQ
jgi:hypothetical protein